MISSVSILGSTGSIGTKAVGAALRLGIQVRALAADKNTRLLEEQARLLRPPLVAAYNERAAKELRAALSDTNIKVVSGEEGLLEAAACSGAQCLLTAVTGAIGLKPTLAAIEAGVSRIALANKETLVCAGELVMEKAGQAKTRIIPVDSEHSAVFQCLDGPGRNRFLSRILLTASGGPLRGKTRGDMAEVTPEEALCHPNWSMGKKVTIDSATMMNKGLELIEAMHLFSTDPEKIEILVHPESIVHSMVEFTDGGILAQLGAPDMTLPIQYALTYPDRDSSGVPSLDFAALGRLTFETPDYEAFPCLSLARRCAVEGGTAPALMNAANEEAVCLFLEGSIGFNDIYECSASAVDNIGIEASPGLDEILRADSEARRYTKRRFGKRE